MVIIKQTMDNIFYRVLLQDKVKIEPKYINKEFRAYVSKKLKTSLEGVCSKHGYIKEGTIDVYKITPGDIDLVGLNGYVTYDVHFYAEVCNPMIGNVVKAKVVNVNKFGILAEVVPILEVIVAKNTVNILSDDSIDLEQIKPGDIVNIEIMGKKFELHDKKISVVGRVVSSISKASVSPKVKHIIKDDEEDDVDKFDITNETSDASDSESGSEEDSDDEKEEKDIDEDIEDDVELDGEGTQKEGGFFDSEEEAGEEEFDFFSGDEEYVSESESDTE